MALERERERDVFRVLFPVLFFRLFFIVLFSPFFFLFYLFDSFFVRFSIVQPRNETQTTWDVLVLGGLDVFLEGMGHQVWLKEWNHKKHEKNVSVPSKKNR